MKFYKIAIISLAAALTFTGCGKATSLVNETGQEVNQEENGGADTDNGANGNDNTSGTGNNANGDNTATQTGNSASGTGNPYLASMAS